jgi:hypothetical protein
MFRPLDSLPLPILAEAALRCLTVKPHSAMEFMFFSPHGRTRASSVDALRALIDAIARGEC